MAFDQCSAYGTDYKEFLKLDEVDIVIIATYTSSPLEILKDCLAHGKHVLCEKPLTTSLSDGEEFLKLQGLDEEKLSLNNFANLSIFK